MDNLEDRVVRVAPNLSVPVDKETYGKALKELMARDNLTVEQLGHLLNKSPGWVRAYTEN